MTRRSYRLPSSVEQAAKRDLAEANRTIEQLLDDCTGQVIIRELEAKVTDLEVKARALEDLKVGYANLRSENNRLKTLAASRKKEVSALKWDVEVAHSYGRELKRKCERLEKRRYEWAGCARRLARELTETKAENAALKARLKRNSNNSSVPPSMCPNAQKVFNSRVKAARRPGGQAGHPGHGRRRYVPDTTVTLLPPCSCPACGGTLKPTGASRSRQLTDIEIKCVTTEYVSAEQICTVCGERTTAAFPKAVVNEANYGDDLRALVTFLVNACNVSIDNTTDFLAEATGGKLVLSKGSVQNFLTLFSKKAQGDVDEIAAHVKAAHVVGTDATFTRSAGRKSYIYTFNTPDSSVYRASDKKGMAPLEGSPLDGCSGTLVHDHDSSYYNFGGSHAECNVHVLRYLKGVCENEPERTWASQMAALLSEANLLAKDGRREDLHALCDDVIKDIELRYDDILQTAEREYEAAGPFNSKYPPEGIALSARLKKYKENHLAFLHDLSVPFENNRSERLLRRTKKKLKQTGGFKSTDNGEKPYCDFLTITQTADMRKMPKLGTIRAIFGDESGLFKETGAKPSAASP